MRPIVLPVTGVLTALAWSVLRSGPDISPVLGDSLAAAVAWPQRLPVQIMAFHTDSPLGLLAYRSAFAPDLRSLAAFGAVSALLSVLALTAWAAAAAYPGRRWRASRLALLLPLSTVLFAWIGSYDPWTVLAWAVVLFAWLSGKRAILVIAGVLLGFQHFEQGLLGVACLWLVWLALRDRLRPPLRTTSPIWVLPGVLLGKALLAGILVASGTEASARSQWLGPYLREWTVTAISVGPILLWSLFAGAWGLVLWLWFTTPDRRGRTYLVVAMSVGLLATAISGDRPRVFVLVMAPALLLTVVVFANSAKPATLESRLVEGLLWLAPPILLWGDKVVNPNVINPIYTTAMRLLGN